MITNENNKISASVRKLLDKTEGLGESTRNHSHFLKYEITARGLKIDLDSLIKDESITNQVSILNQQQKEAS